MHPAAGLFFSKLKSNTSLPRGNRLQTCTINPATTIAMALKMAIVRAAHHLNNFNVVVRWKGMFERRSGRKSLRIVIKDNMMVGT
jgi:hypothetical protein